MAAQPNPKLTPETVAQDAIHVEQWSRADAWTLREYQASSLALASEVTIPSTALPQVQITLSDIYESRAD